MVDFVLVSSIVTVMFLALVQLALALYVRNTVADAASSAARYGALADRTAQDARDRAELLIGSALGGGFARDVSAAVGSSHGVPVLTVSVTAPLPLLGLWGPDRTLEMSGHAVIAR